MSANSVVAIGWDVFKIVFVPVKHRFEYVMCSKRYVDGLRKEVGNLKYETERVRSGAERATTNLDYTHEWVDEFLASAKTALEDAEDLLDKFKNMIKTCCRGTLPDPICHYQFGRKAKHTTDDIKSLILNNKGKEISYCRPAPGNFAARREGKDVVQLTSSGIFESRASVMQEIMDALANDTKSVVGVHGMGGIGKSTLLVDVERILCENKLFDWVAKADVSQNPDIKTIQKEIAHCLGLSTIKEEEDVKLRAKLLLERLEDEERNKRKVLIILDDLWEQLDLKLVGIPCGHNNKVKGCKLLTTARDQYVLERQMLCDVAFHLGLLKDEEAKGLFEATMGGKFRVELEPLVEKALHICGGLPFLILVIARLFINTTDSECENALNEILNGEAGEKIARTLRVSYNHLKREEQSLLQLCAVYCVPNPSLEDLMRYGMGLGLFGSDRSMKDAREMLGRLIRTLQASSLLLYSKEDASFKIHDLVRMFVTSIVSRDHPLLVLKDESVAELWKDKVKRCGALCFPYVNFEELPKKLDCPDLKIFMLFNTHNFLEVPDSYFNSMGNLMVLDLMGIRLSRSPSPLQSLEKLHTLCLSNCLLENVAILGELKKLQILCIQSSYLHGLPQEIGQLTELRLLDLNGCSNLQMIESGVLGSLTKLEELYMENIFFEWNDMGQRPPTNASLIELNNMKNLCTLYVSILDPSVLPDDMNFKRLSKYIIKIGKWQCWRSCGGSSVLELCLDPKSDVLQKGCIQSILGKTDDLFLEDLNGSEQSICTLSQKGFPQLKHLQVVNSPSVRYILQSSSHADFEKLEWLLLKSLIKLEKICHDHISSKSFGALKVVQVRCCDKMEVLFPLSVARGLPQLEEIAVDDCKSMCGIIKLDDRGKLELPKLRVLKLRDLPNIKSFFTDGAASSSRTANDQVGTPIAFFNGQQVAFPRMETLEIIGLAKLELMFFPSMVKSLPQLRDLTVQHCKKLEAIIMEEERLGLETLETLAFPMLTNLCLEWLESLICFSHEKCSREALSRDHVQSHCAALFSREVAFPSLEELIISGLGNIKMIWDNQVAVDSFYSLESLKVDACNRLKRIWHNEFHHQVKLHCLRSIHIFGCMNLASLFSASVARDLIQLEELTIDDCGIVELIEKEEGLVPRFVLPQLTSLELMNLTELTCTYAGAHPLHWPALKTLKVQGCNKVEILASQLENSMPLQKRPLFLIEKIAFPRLETLEIIGLDNLRFIFSPSVVKSLSQLRELAVSKRDKMEAIIVEEEGSGLETTETQASLIEGEVAFHQLEYIKLDGLRELRCFSSGGYNLMFPLLEDIIVGGCPNMKFFSEGLIKTPNLERVQAISNGFFESTKHQNFWEGNLNIAIQNIFEEMGTFAAVKEMWLSEIPKLIGKWQSELNPIKSYWQVNSLIIDKCPSFVNAIAPKLMLDLDNLSTLQVLNCELLEELDLEGLEIMENTLVLPQLETLTFGYLPKLRQLWNKDLQGMLHFNSLTSLTLYKCGNLRHAFAPSMVQYVASLEWMEIKECAQMEKVIAEEEGQGSAVESIMFRRLCSIVLECLPNLTSFLSGKNHMLECPEMQVLTIAHCPRMRSLTSGPSLFTSQVQFLQLQRMVLSHMDNLSKIWSDGLQETLTFDSLMRVEAQSCKNLENLFPYWVATSLNQLNKLRLESCGIEEIVASGDDTPHCNVTEVLFPKLTSLVLHDMPRLKSFFPNLSTLNLPLVEELRVTHCDKLNKLSFAASMNSWAQINDRRYLSDQEAHSSFEKAILQGFPNLERVLLVEKDIHTIEDGKFSIDILGKPKAVTLACFHDENAVFPPRIFLERFQNLESLEVFCSSFEDIFPDEEIVDKGTYLVLEKLRELKLSKLPNLKHVWREDYLISKILRSIKTFQVWDCPSLIILFPIVTSFHNLTKLVVKNSSGLVYLITISAIMNLVHLTKMTIIGCERMKEIVDNDENEEGKVISFEKLEWLTLQQLPSLECFSSITSCSFRFPSLQSIRVEECPKMKIFSKGTLSTPKLCYGRLFGYKWSWEGDLNAIIRKLST